MSTKPHVSQAIVGLRTWVSMTGTVVCLAALAQLLVFGFVRFTDVRFSELKGEVDEAPLQVIASDARGTGVAGSGTETRAARRGSSTAKTDSSAETEPNHVLSTTDVLLHRTSDIAVSFGTIAAVMLPMLTMMGVAVAGGGRVPGVEKATTAATWAIVLGALCVPWRDILPTLPIPGVFAPYDAVIAAGEQEIEGTVGLARFIGLPIFAVACSLFVVYWFRSGVERGVILTSVSEIDEALDREMHSIRKRGAAGSAPRTVGALNRALGDDDDDDDIPTLRAAAGAEGLAGLPMRAPKEDEGGGRTMSGGKADPGDPLSRPI